MAAISSIIAGIAAGIAAAGTSYAVVSGERAAGEQEKAMEQQKQAQNSAVAQARSQQRKSQQAMAAANRQEPNVANIMGRAAAEMGNTGSSTMLTGPTGVNPMDLSLGRSSLLGS